jgi:hypothetical protein
MVKFRTLCRSAIVIWIWNSFSALATVYESDGSAASVQGLHNAVLNGDTITLPSGTFTWTTSVSISKWITIKGAGVGRTICQGRRPVWATNSLVACGWTEFAPYRD